MATGNQLHVTRSSALITGILLMLASVPLLFFALLLGSRGEMIGFESSADHLRLAALVSFPVLMIAIGGALLWGSRTGRYRLSLLLAVLAPVDAAAIAGTYSLLDRPQLPVAIPPSDPDALVAKSSGELVNGPPALVRQTSVPPAAGCPRNGNDCDVATIVALDTSTALRPQPAPKPSPAISPARR